MGEDTVNMQPVGEGPGKALTWGREATFPTHPLGHGAIYGHRWVSLAKADEGTTATGEWGPV